jgi:hypothetical protein
MRLVRGFPARGLFVLRNAKTALTWAGIFLGALALWQVLTFNFAAIF